MAQTVEPVYPIPPHWPHSATVPEPVDVVVAVATEELVFELVKLAVVVDDVEVLLATAVEVVVFEPLPPVVILKIAISWLARVADTEVPVPVVSEYSSFHE